ncbi:MAG TPA: helix-hairpin-helix domain-containing protein, partial [Phycisphaerales bacterium]|nr:helix-hairpin-helix domain-containing protein [Phycisphaerales bacterium]
MRQNAALAEQLLRVARLLELTGADRFRVLAHEKAARAVEGLSVDISSLACDERALRRIEGIGPKMAEKIAEFCTTGKIAELARLSTEVPAGIEELLRVPGLGPKTILKLWKEAGVNDLATLEKAIKDGTLLALKGMGEQKVSAMARGLEEMRRARGEAQGAGEAGAAPRTVRRLPLGLAWPVAERFVELLRGVEGVVRCEAAGSLRRGRETVGDIDILVAARDAASAAAASAAFRNGPGVREVLAAGPTKSSVRAAVLAELGRWGRELAGEEALKGPSVQVDLRVVEPDSWGAALQYFTGSKEHNVKVRERAVKRGLTLNEYGLFRLPGGNGARGGGRRPAKDPVREAEVEQGAGGTAQRGERVAGAHEQEIYAALGLGPIPPEVREDRGEIERYELAGDGP